MKEGLAAAEPGGPESVCSMHLALQNFLFWALFLVVSAVFIPVGALAVTVYGLVVIRRRPVLRFIRVAIKWYGKFVQWCAWPFVRIRFQDLAPREAANGCVLVCNHRSSSDPFLMACLPFSNAVQVVNVWPFRIPVLGIVAKIGGYLSVREMTPEEFMARAARLLSDGVAIIAFPEGTRSGSAQMGPFHGTVFRLAMSARVPVVPLAITGSENVPRKGAWLLHPGTIRVAKLPSVCWHEYRDMSAFKLKNHVRDILQSHLDTPELGALP